MNYYWLALVIAFVVFGLVRAKRSGEVVITIALYAGVIAVVIWVMVVLYKHPVSLDGGEPSSAFIEKRDRDATPSM